MVFPSIPAYLDPSNWQQQPNHPAGVRTGNPRLPPPLPPSPPPPPPPHVGSGLGSIRPGSMADRARMANIPLPEAALKCPRCESTNTKFCYFNNYSLTQPRHFCKTCRRYWTRGGALRNVPVGGGCRRNKRSKGGGSSGTTSKSPASGDRQTSCSGNNSSSAVNSSNSAGTTASILGLTPQIPPLRFMAPLSSHLGDHQYGGGEMGLNYSGISISAPNLVATSEMNFQLGSSSLGGEGGGSYLSAGGGGVEQWRLQPLLPQICSLGGLDLQPGLYPFQDGGGGGDGVGAEASGYGGECGGGGGGQVRGKLSGSGLISQMASVKMEDNQQELNLSRQFLGIPGNHDQYWSGSYDLSGFSSPSTTSHI